MVSSCIIFIFFAEQRKKLPLLEVNGKKISQSYAIAKYVAREFGKSSCNSCMKLNARIKINVAGIL